MLLIYVNDLPQGLLADIELFAVDILLFSVADEVDDSGSKLTNDWKMSHCVKSARIGSYSGPHFPAFGLNMERYSVSFRIQSECGKMQTRITPNADNFYARSFNLD